MAGIPTPDWRVEKVADRDVMLLRRFDRRGNVRIPFLSAMSLLNAADNEPHSYMEIADACANTARRPTKIARSSGGASSSAS